MNIETANRLLNYRKKFNLSQEELAAKIGVSRQAISKWERAEASPDTDNLILLAEIYGVTLDELLKGGSDNSGENAGIDDKDTYNYNYSYSYSPDGTKESKSETKYKKADHVSFKNGIHVDTKEGDHVHIGFDGIHVNDKDGTKFNLDSHGINVEENGKQKVFTDENGNVIYDESIKKCHCKSKWYKFPFFIFAIIAFLLWGFSGVCFGWALSWICFLTIPIYYTLIDAITKRKASHFAYPVLTVIAYILFGFFGICGGWTYGWIAFLTIPVYYWICSLFGDDGDDYDKDD